MFYTREKEHGLWATLSGINLRIDAIRDDLKQHVEDSKPSRITKQELMNRWGIDSNRDFDLLVSYYPITPMKPGLFFLPRFLFGRSWEEGDGWSMHDVEAYEGKNAFLGNKLWDMIAEAHALRESNEVGC